MTEREFRLKERQNRIMAETKEEHETTFQTPTVNTSYSYQRSERTLTFSNLLAQLLDENKLLRKEMIEAQTKTNDLIKDLTGQMKTLQQCNCKCSCNKTKMHPDTEEISEDEPNISSQAQRLRYVYDKQWKYTLNNRKHEFYKYLQNTEKADIYQEFLNLDPPYIPSTCKEKEINNDSKDLKKVNEEREKENVLHEIRKMKIFADEHLKKVATEDRKMSEQFANVESEETKTELQTLWKKDTDKEEENSRKIWKKNYCFLLDSPNRESNTNNDHDSKNRPQTKPDTNFRNSGNSYNNYRGSRNEYSRAENSGYQNKFKSGQGGRAPFFDRGQYKPRQR